MTAPTDSEMRRWLYHTRRDERIAALEGIIAERIATPLFAHAPPAPGKYLQLPKHDDALLLPIRTVQDYKRHRKNVRHALRTRIIPDIEGRLKAHNLSTPEIMLEEDRGLHEAGAYVVKKKIISTDTNWKNCPDAHRALDIALFHETSHHAMNETLGEEAFTPDHRMFAEGFATGMENWTNTEQGIYSTTFFNGTTDKLSFALMQLYAKSPKPSHKRIAHGMARQMLGEGSIITRDPHATGFAIFAIQEQTHGKRLYAEVLRDPYALLE